MSASKQQHVFVSGKYSDDVYKAVVKPTRWEILSKGIPEAEWIHNEALCDFASRHKNHYYVPERFLNALRLETEFDGEPSAFSLVNGVVLPAADPLQEEVEPDGTPQTT